MPENSSLVPVCGDGHLRLQANKPEPSPKLLPETPCGYVPVHPNDARSPSGSSPTPSSGDRHLHSNKTEPPPDSTYTAVAMKANDPIANAIEGDASNIQIAAQQPLSTGESAATQFQSPTPYLAAEQTFEYASSKPSEDAIQSCVMDLGSPTTASECENDTKTTPEPALQRTVSPTPEQLELLMSPSPPSSSPSSSQCNSSNFINSSLPTNPCRCNVIRYCSRECQEQDAPAHQLLCNTWNELHPTHPKNSRPSETYRSAIFFPENPEDGNACFVWLQHWENRTDSGTCYDQPIVGQYFDNVAKLTKVNIVENLVLCRPLDHTIQIVTACRNDSEYALKTNSSIASLVDARHAFRWKGPLLAYGLQGDLDLAPKGSDLDLHDLRHIVDYLNTNKSTALANEMRYFGPTYHGVRIKCEGDLEPGKTQAQGAFEAVKIPVSHKIFSAGHLLPIADRIKIPILSTSIPRKADYEAGSTSTQGGRGPRTKKGREDWNPRARDLNAEWLMTTDEAIAKVTTVPFRDWATKQYYPGTVIFARQDHKPLYPLHLHALWRYNKYLLEPLMTRASEIHADSDTSEVDKEISKEKFSTYHRHFLTFQSTDVDRQLPSPYDVKKRVGSLKRKAVKGLFARAAKRARWEWTSDGDEEVEEEEEEEDEEAIRADEDGDLYSSCREHSLYMLREECCAHCADQVERSTEVIPVYCNSGFTQRTPTVSGLEVERVGSRDHAEHVRVVREYFIVRRQVDIDVVGYLVLMTTSPQHGYTRCDLGKDYLRKNELVRDVILGYLGPEMMTVFPAVVINIVTFTLGMMQITFLSFPESLPPPADVWDAADLAYLSKQPFRPIRMHHPIRRMRYSRLSTLPQARPQTTMSTAQKDIENVPVDISLLPERERRELVIAETASITNGTTLGASSSLQPVKSLTISTQGKPLTPAYNTDGSIAYLSDRTQRSLGNCVLTDADKMEVISTTYFWGPGKDPVLHLIGAAGKNDEIKIASKWTSRAQTFVLPDDRTFEWHYKREKGFVGIDQKGDEKKGTALVLTMEEKRVAALIRNDHTRTLGSKSCSAGNGGELILGELAARGKESVSEAVVVATCQPMLKKEVDRRRTVQIGMISSNVSAQCSGIVHQ
ncbi:hypothetical protein K504DRAFT_495291 [Pleomassaria siparia CBS 279.74]|uniref:MYND-type domain-containing protein n=1 Tax=Pleomassaria siparia CBS 279.74 TaxID=1314801 RepID=A0A6G1JT10_9PLEO|nr:hypothetical protein K504DRAFT_495291 [Pleomassaria siparia CBS 279.74]